MSPSGQSGLYVLTWHTLLVALVCLVELCDGYVNVARGKPTAQKDTYDTEGPTDSGRAVDGEYDLSTHGCTHTISDTNTWWIVDFLKDYVVHKVIIVNRPTLSERLQKFTVQVSQENPLKHAGFPFSLPGQKCFYQNYPISPSSPETLPCSSPIIGRYLTVFKAANRHLTICELEAMATNVTQQTQLQAFTNIRKQAMPFFTKNQTRSSLECVSVCSNHQNGTATVVQRRGNDGSCECIQFSYFDVLKLSDVTSPDWVMYLSKYN